MFPKNYCYNVEYLVKLWKYQGLIESKGNKSAEKIGFEYAQQLYERSLFETEGISERNDFVKFKLHDIVHDLAQLNSENGCYSIVDSKLPIFPNVLYHLYVADYVNLIDPIPSDKLTALRTLITVSSVINLFSTFDLSMAPKLRALEIRVSRDCKLEFLSSVGNLKHLRYLSLNELCSKTLPECICSLHSLQNLTLWNSKLEELPTYIGNLISLEELIIDDCNLMALPESLCQLKTLKKLCLIWCGLLEEIPSDMGSLTNLQTLQISYTGVSYLPPSLSKFVGIQTLKVELTCKTIGWLKDFPDLGGTLFLRGLRNLSNLMDVKCADLVSMRNLEHLILSWNGNYIRWDIFDSVPVLIIEIGQDIFLENQSCFSVMDSLQPHSNLNKLEIDGYSGITFPEWIGSLCKLKYLNITLCESLEFLKAEFLPSEIEELEISRCHQLVSIPGIQKLKSLVKLSIDNCHNLCSFMESSLELTTRAGVGSYRSCSLLGLTNLDSLRSLQISNCWKLRVLGDELLPSEPCKVVVSDCPGLSEWCLQHGINYKGILSSSLSTVNDDYELSSTTETMSTVNDDYALSSTTDTMVIASWVRGQKLGDGPFGTVYEGISDEGFFFAVKEVLIDRGINAQQSISQLEQEIRFLSQFEHENIVQYYGTDKEESKLYIFVELMTQGSLASLYQKYHLQDTHVSEYTRQILYGLVYLHQSNIVHRDIKCANILVNANGSVKLADFGLAKELTKINILKSVKGSVYWMAPEVVNPKKSYGLEADIWSLGCTVLEMLAREIPYPNIEWTHALFKIGRGEPPPIPNYLSREAQDFITQCVRVNPDDRPSAVQLLEHPFVKIPLPLLYSPPSSQSSPSQTDP